MRIAVIFILFNASFYNMAIAQSGYADIYRGNEAYHKGNYTEAGKNYSLALETKKNQVAEFNLGNVYYQQDRFDSAIKHFKEVTESGSNQELRASAYYNMGNSFLKSKRWQEAEKSFRECLKLIPNNSQAKYNLEYARRMMKEENKESQKQEDQAQKPGGKDKHDADKNEKSESKPSQSDSKSSDQKSKSLPSKLSKEQADQILNALNQEENKLRGKSEKIKGLPLKLDKDW